MGSVSYFMQLNVSNYLREVRVIKEERLSMSCKSITNGKCNEKGSSSENVAVTMDDSLISESFILLLYGQTAAALVLFSETLISFIIRALSSGFKIVRKIIARFLQEVLLTEFSFTQS